MSVSNDDRQAYENGQTEKAYIRAHPIAFLLTGGVRSRPSDPSKAAAYDKGLSGDQLDEDDD